MLTDVRVAEDAGSVSYGFLTLEGSARFRARLSQVRGIRIIHQSEEFDEFLDDFMPLDPSVMKKIGGITWKMVDGDRPELPSILIE